MASSSKSDIGTRNAPSELHPLLPVAKTNESPKRIHFRSLPRWKQAILAAWLLWMGFLMKNDIQRMREYFHSPPAPSPGPPDGVCPQEKPMHPPNSLSDELRDVYGTMDFTDRAARALSDAVKVPTEVFEDFGPLESGDQGWEVFAEFHDYLRSTFPKVHATLSLTKVNTYGLLYKWQGSDPSLAPILLMAHQDVVPVDRLTWHHWTEPPFSGAYKDGWIWGRGSCDDKGDLVGIMLSVETLLEQGFKPHRTVVLSFGFDEETTGREGGRKLAAYLMEHGPKEFAMIVDEGGTMDRQFGRTFAYPAIAEKGYFDLKVEVNTDGGHSSIPPKHTSIGYLALLIAQIEAHPHPAKLQRDSPVFQTLECMAVYAPEIPTAFKREILMAAQGSDRALHQVEQMILGGAGTPNTGDAPNYLAALMGTTQAVDLISGGIKVNALPEQAFAIINHRIDIDSSVEALKGSILALIQQSATTYNFEVVGFDGNITSPLNSSGRWITLSDAWGTALEPSPKTPTDTAAYRLLSGTIRAAWEESNPEEDSVVVAPSMMGGNTDTNSYWGLSKHIFRYSHRGTWHAKNGVHTVDEALRADGLVSFVSFMSKLILNADGSREI